MTNLMLTKALNHFRFLRCSLILAVVQAYDVAVMGLHLLKIIKCLYITIFIIQFPILSANLLNILKYLYWHKGNVWINDIAVKQRSTFVTSMAIIFVMLKTSWSSVPNIVYITMELEITYICVELMIFFFVKEKAESSKQL